MLLRHNREVSVGPCEDNRDTVDDRGVVVESPGNGSVNNSDDSGTVGDRSTGTSDKRGVIDSEDGRGRGGVDGDRLEASTTDAGDLRAGCRGIR